MENAKNKLSLFYIPAGISFTDSLVSGLFDEIGADSAKLSPYTVLLPTRRACRGVREAFLRQTAGKPMLLPRLQPIGDVDADELSLMALAGGDDLNIPPALPPLKRQIMLAQLIARGPDSSRGVERDMALAAALGGLMDQVYTENLSLKNLPNLVDESQFAEHWQLTVNFLNILATHWPNILAENGVIDAADRQNRLIRALTARWKQNPPPGPVIAAGSTGTIPATAELLAVIAGLPQGRVILPGLDPDIDDDSWAAMEETHPQFTLKTLLNRLETERTSVNIWPAASKSRPAATLLARELMRPADTSAAWENLTGNAAMTSDILACTRHIHRYDVPTAQDEAGVIATILRETLTDPAQRKTAAVITADRDLARRVAAMCRRWGIDIDDSAGRKLTATSAGTFLILAAKAAIDGLSPATLMALLKHGLSSHKMGDGINLLEQNLLRGPSPNVGIRGIIQFLERVKNNIPADTYTRLEAALIDLQGLFSEAGIFETGGGGSALPFDTCLSAHIRLAENLCPPETLWAGEDGEAAAAFLSDLRTHQHLIPPVTPSAYLSVLESLMDTLTVRPAYGKHPRVIILGQLEARLYQADVMILAGLNEGSWPPAPATDPWMSRPMRADFGLPSPDRGIGLSAHDFVQGLCAPHVILTRAKRADKAPTVPARWLSRLDTVLDAADAGRGSILNGPHAHWAGALDRAPDVTPAARPAPAPPVTSRPRRLSVTQIDTWLRDPYSVYARHILKLEKLKPLEQAPDAAIKGTLLHAVMEGMIQKYPHGLPDEDTLVAHFLSLAQERLSAFRQPPGFKEFWQPRLIRIAQWVARQEQTWRQDWKPLKPEAKGVYTFATPGGEFTLSGRADRVDIRRDGTRAAIIDYKSSKTGLSANKIHTALNPQMPLEAWMLKQGAFKDIPAMDTACLAYWILNGGRDEGEMISLSSEPDIAQAAETARDMVQSLIAAFDDERTPYLSQPRAAFTPAFNDYEHLARTQEWTAQGEGEDS